MQTTLDQPLTPTLSPQAGWHRAAFCGIVLVTVLLLGGRIHPGDYAEDFELKCLELTRIAANSLELAPADKDWCNLFGRTMKRKTGINQEPYPPPPSTISHDQLIALIDKFIALNPTYGKEPLAAKTMYTVDAIVNNNWNWPADTSQ